MLNKDNERELAYLVTIDEIKPIIGYDRVEYARTSGWWVIVRKDQFKVGDIAVYFEIDSKVPETEPFKFLEKRHYKVKTIKMCKVISQGLLMHPNDFGWEVCADGGVRIKEHDIHYVNDESRFVTKLLGVTYASEEDNKRKANAPDRYKVMAQRRPNIFKKKWARWFMRREWGRKLMFVLFGKKKDKQSGWPTKFPYIKKTDEDRIENLPMYWGYKEPLIVTEKLDGTSTTFILARTHNLFKPYEFYVLSRNVRQRTPDQKCFHDDNVYWEMAFKYDIEDVLHKILDSNKKYEYVCIQGETVGKDLQGNPLKLGYRDFYAFNFIDSINGRWGSVEGAELLGKYGIKWVPILDMEYYIPETIEDIKKDATARSIVNTSVLREGLVMRAKDGSISFKNVSNEYLLSKNE